MSEERNNVNISSGTSDRKATKSKKRIFASKRFKYGSSAVTFTIAFIAVVVLINVMLTTLTTNFHWFIDMTTEGLYTISDSVHELIDPLNGRDDVNIKIVFCMPKDQLEETYYYKLVHQSALNFAREFDFIDVEYIDVVAHPSSANPYRTTAGSTIKTTNVIITNNSDFRVFAMEGFYTFSEESSEAYALNAEYKITTAIIQMTEKNPIAYFTTNHGEVTTSSSLWELLSNAGYDVRTIDLTKDSIDYENAQLVIINGPRYDFAGNESEVDEIKKIDAFLDNGGNMMVFMDPKAYSLRPLENLDQLLYEWGIKFEKNIIKNVENSINVAGTSLSAVYAEDGAGASLSKSVRSLESTPKVIVPYAMPITSTYRDGESSTVDQGSREISTVLYSPDKSYAYDFEDETSEVAQGQFSVMTITSETRYIDNEAHYNYVLACGTTEFISEDLVSSNAYGNADIMYSAMKLMGKNTVPNGIPFRIFDNNKLDVTAGQAYTWTIIFTAFIPVVVIIVGIAVFVRRRHL